MHQQKAAPLHPGDALKKGPAADAGCRDLRFRVRMGVVSGKDVE